jgi:type I restriction enzyme S subunit
MTEMKQGWEIKKLGDVLVKTETIDPTKKPNEEFIYLDVSSVNKETKEIENASVLKGKDAPSRARKLVRLNDVIFATVRPTHSRVALITEEYDEQVCSTGYFVLRGKQFIYNQYLFYFLLTDEFNGQMEKLQKGASYPAVTDAEVKSIFLRFPSSLPEQQRIVSILDQTFTALTKAKENAQRNLQNAKDLFESYLQGVFEKKGEGWEEKTLSEICEVKDGTHDSPKYIKEGIPFVTQKNIRKEGLSFDDTKYITESDHTKFYKRSNVAFGDILISMIGANRGMAAIVNDERVFSIKNVGLIKQSKNINKYFLLYYLKSTIALKYVLYMSNGGAQEFVGLTALRSFPIPIPSLAEQQTIVTKLDTLSIETKRFEAIYQQKLINLEELKKSVLQKAFNGEL